MPTIIDRDTLITELGKLALEQGGLGDIEITENTHFKADLDFDSIDTMEYVMTIEDKYNIEIPDETASAIETVGQTADALIGIL